MSYKRLAADVTIVVLFTLLVAGAGYAGMATQLHRTAQTQLPTPSPAAPTKPLPAPVPPAPPSQAGGLFVWDADFVDQQTGWLLATDCTSQGPATCHYSVEGTRDAGVTWSRPVAVGPLFSSTDGDAPRNIRFLDERNGFVFGHSNAYVTHDGGATWADTGFQGEVVTIEPFENAVWAVTRPCAKGVACQYQALWSLDGGQTWAPAHQLPTTFSAEALAAFGSGAILSALPPDTLELITYQRVLEQEIKSPCGTNQWRERAATADGVEIWVLCQAYPNASGVIDTATLFVSHDGGKTWSQSGVPGTVPALVVTPRPKVALVVGTGSLLQTTDSGRTWAAVGASSGPYAFVRFLSADRGWAMDQDRIAWMTADGGTSWFQVTTVPDTRP